MMPDELLRDSCGDCHCPIGYHVTNPHPSFAAAGAPCYCPRDISWFRDGEIEHGIARIVEYFQIYAVPEVWREREARHLVDWIVVPQEVA